MKQSSSSSSRSPSGNRNQNSNSNDLLNIHSILFSAKDQAGTPPALDDVHKSPQEHESHACGDNEEFVCPGSLVTASAARTGGKMYAPDVASSAVHVLWALGDQRPSSS